MRSIIYLIMILLFVVSCTRVEKTLDNVTPDENISQLPAVENVTVNVTEEPAIPDSTPELLALLNFSPSTYTGNYTLMHNYSKSGDKATASTNYTEASDIYIIVKQREIRQYTLAYNIAGTPIEDQLYYETYEPGSNGICRTEVVSHTPCYVSREPIQPGMSGYIDATTINTDGPAYYAACEGYNQSISVEGNISPDLPCQHTIYAKGLEIWDEYNIIYYPEQDKSLCYFIAHRPGERYAIECSNDDMRLVTDIGQSYGLYNEVCKYRKYNYACDCTFDPVRKNAGCRPEKPANTDTYMKARAAAYLLSVNKTVAKDGSCFTLADSSGKFCFDTYKLMTSAEYGPAEPGNTDYYDFKMK